MSPDSVLLLLRCVPELADELQVDHTLEECSKRPRPLPDHLSDLSDCAKEEQLLNLQLMMKLKMALQEHCTLELRLDE